MDGIGTNLKSLMQSKALEVPFFQRPYVWEDQHFEALIDSFDDSPKNIMPFFGSVILKEFGGVDSGQYLIIDGQQRCMTFSILIRAILDVCSGGDHLSATQVTRLVDCIYTVYENTDGDEMYLSKLTPSNPDKMSYDEVMSTESTRPIQIVENTTDSIERAYKYFYNFFLVNTNKIKLFYNKLVSENNSIIKINLTAADDEQKIFDSVNSMGKSLSNADIIKNYIFQKLRENAKDDGIKKNQITDLYTKYWDSIFYVNEKKEFWYKELTVGRLKTDNLESFLKDYAIIKKIYAAKKTTGTYGLCNAFKEHINHLNDGELISFVKEINEYARVYYEYKTEYQELNEFVWSDYKNRILLVLDNLDTTTFNPYILKVLKEMPSEAETRFMNIEKFLLQRFIYDGTTKNYNQCCEKLMVVEDDAKYLQEYMKESPVVNDSYKPRFRKFNNNQARLLIFMIEMLYRNGEEDKYSDGLRIDTYSLEHIMPQKWQNTWYDVASYDENGQIIDRNDVEKFVQGRDRAVKSLGNFALLTTKLNISVSNSNFETKINGKSSGSNPGGIKKYAASLVTTKDILEVYENTKIWDEREIYAHEDKYFEKLNGFYKFI